MEIWKPVKNYENIYEVSSLGRVREIKTNKILKQSKNRGSQLLVSLIGDHFKGSYSVRNIVAESFLNYNKTSKKIVYHIDYNLSNNSVENLQVISKKDYEKKQRYNETRQDGVTYIKEVNKWAAVFNHNKNSISLGLFDTEKNAIAAIKTKFKKKHVLIKKGVYFHPFTKKYRAIQLIEGNPKFLGSFNTSREAYEFYLMNKFLK